MTFIKNLGELRPNQFITSFGPGSIIDAVNDSVTVLDLDYWQKSKNCGQKIKDSRLARFLDVKNFYKPTTGTENDIPVVPFPNYHVCSNKKCGLLFDIRKTENFDSELYEKKNGLVKCPKCKNPAYPARLITICKAGHMDDFPWSWWVHKGNSNCKENLKLYSNGQTSTLAELIVECLECGAKRSLYGATAANIASGWTCTGHFPERPLFKNIECKSQAVFSQRGASNVYFSVTKSALSLPEWTNEIMEEISEHQEAIETLVEVLGEEDGLGKAYEKYFSPKYSKEEFLESWKKSGAEIGSFADIKSDEYKTIIHHKKTENQNKNFYFKAEDEKVPDKLNPYFSRIIRIHRLREVVALVGFTRLSAPEPDTGGDEEIVKLNVNKKDRWLPAVEIYGEGVFLELNDEKLKVWMQNPLVQKRSREYQKYYRDYCKSRGWNNFAFRDAKYVLLHTLSHLLIKQMALNSGYASASLKERIYSDENMNGILIYTGTAGKEGSLGGLVELGKSQKFETLLSDSLENALTCTTDPECFEREPNPKNLNGAACHSCCMISETSCECGNRLLDRALAVPLAEKEEMAFFADFV